MKETYSTYRIKQAAVQNGWSVSTRLNDPARFTLQSRDERSTCNFSGTRPEHAKSESVNIVRDKVATYDYLNQHGYNVLPTYQINNIREVHDLLSGYRSIVIKPSNGQESRGVTAGITDCENIDEAIRFASQYGEGVAVQPYIEGKLYRVLVIDGHVVATVERTPGFVVGDGVLSIEELIRKENLNILRGPDYTTPMPYINPEHAKMFVPDLNEIPYKGKRVILSNTISLSNGGFAIDVSSQLPQSIRRICVSISKELGLYISGFDFISKNISLLDTEPLPLLEINSAPGLALHYCARGNTLDAATYIIKSIEKAID